MVHIPHRVKENVEIRVGHAALRQEELLLRLCGRRVPLRAVVAGVRDEERYRGLAAVQPLEGVQSGLGVLVTVVAVGVDQRVA